MATVRGKNNALVANLQQSDFKIFEDGKEQEIKYFTRESNLPLTIGMLIDVSGSMEGLIPAEQRAGSKFFEQVLRKDDLGVHHQLRQGFGIAAGLDEFTSSARSRA